MEPQSNNLENLSKNNLERTQQSPEVSSLPDQRKLEKVPIGALEHLGGDTSHERSGVINDNPQGTANDVTITLPSVPGLSQDDTTNNATATSAPVLAADDDVIEKEWVNKVKGVINQTKGDPYSKEREVSKLQSDYMQKRYGKQIKINNEAQ